MRIRILKPENYEKFKEKHHLEFAPIRIEKILSDICKQLKILIKVLKDK